MGKTARSILMPAAAQPLRPRPVFIGFPVFIFNELL